MGRKLRKSLQMDRLPKDREPTLRVITRPNDANPSGDIFGGWLMSQIDIAGATVAKIRAKGPIATVAVKELVFIKPIFVYDIVSFYALIDTVGTTSLTVSVQVFAQRLITGKIATIKVADAKVVFVAVIRPGKKRKVPR